MRYDAEHKQRTHEKVVKAAAKAIRAKGAERIGVADIMADVGLTHGGFYAHFKSKDDLVAAAVGQMFTESRARLVRETENRTPKRALSDYLDFYLSREHRDARRSGCPVAALASDLPRLKSKVREQFSDGYQRLIAALSSLLAQIGHESPESQAHSMFSEMLGALSMARIESDEVRSDAILENSIVAIKRRIGLE